MDKKNFEKKIAIEIEPSIFDYTREIASSMDYIHFHNTYEIYFLTEGKRHYLVEHRLFEVSEGDLIVIPPRIVHRSLNTFDAKPNDYTARYLLSPKESYIPNNLKKVFGKYHYKLSEEDKKFVFENMKAIKKEIEIYDEFSLQLYKNHLYSILVMLARSYADLNNKENFDNSRKIGTVIQNIIDYISKNIKNDISLSELAERYGYTKEYLSAEFKKIAGCRYNEFLNATRIATSAKLLVTTEYPIKTIADMCGYKNTNYFATVFKKEMNMSPSEYRNQL